MDALSLTLPIASITGLVGVVMWATFVFTNERNRIDKRMDSIVNSVQHLAVSLESFANNIQNAVQDRYSIAEHELWCARTEALNLNWKSASLPRSYNQKDATATAIALESVRRQMDSIEKKDAN